MPDAPLLMDVLFGHWPQAGGRWCGGCGASSLSLPDDSPMGDSEFYDKHLADALRKATGSDDFAVIDGRVVPLSRPRSVVSHKERPGSPPGLVDEHGHPVYSIPKPGCDCPYCQEAPDE